MKAVSNVLTYYYNKLVIPSALDVEDQGAKLRDTDDCAMYEHQSMHDAIVNYAYYVRLGN